MIQLTTYSRKTVETPMVGRLCLKLAGPNLPFMHYRNALILGLE